jgi:hypothetical protein
MGAGIGSGGFGAVRHLSALLLFCAKTEVAARSDATIHGFVFENTFSIFCSPF